MNTKNQCVAPRLQPIFFNSTHLVIQNISPATPLLQLPQQDLHLILHTLHLRNQPPILLLPRPLILQTIAHANLTNILPHSILQICHAQSILSRSDEGSDDDALLRSIGEDRLRFGCECVELRGEFREGDVGVGGERFGGADDGVVGERVSFGEDECVGDAGVGGGGEGG